MMRLVCLMITLGNIRMWLAMVSIILPGLVINQLNKRRLLPNNPLPHLPLLALLTIEQRPFRFGLLELHRFCQSLMSKGLFGELGFGMLGGEAGMEGLV